MPNNARPTICPQCGVGELVPEAFELAVCPTCRGVWLDDSEDASGEYELVPTGRATFRLMRRPRLAAGP